MEFTLDELNGGVPADDGFTLDELNGESKPVKVENQSDPEYEQIETDAENTPAFYPGDDDEHVKRVKAHKGATIGHYDRPFRINRDENTGKVTGYSTTESTVVPELDGTFSVIPTIWKDKRDGAVLTAIDDIDAATHYRETEVGKEAGERFGNFATEDEAKAAAQDIHELHQKAYSQKWNQYIHEHWDEMSDEIKNDPDVAKAHEGWERAGRPKFKWERRKQSENDSESELTDADTPKEKGEVLETVRQSMKSETGKDYGKGLSAALGIAPFGSKVAKMNADLQMASAERLVNGDYKDEEAEQLFNHVFGGDKYKYAKAESVNSLESQEQFRNFMADRAKEWIAENVKSRQEAEDYLTNRPLSAWGKVGSMGIQGTGYMLEYMLPAGMIGNVTKGVGVSAKIVNGLAHGAVPFLGSAAERYSDFTTNGYGIDDDGEVYVAEKADTNGRAAFKAARGAAGEVAVEMVGGEVLGAGAKLVGKGALKTIGYAGRKVVGGLNRTGAGRVIVDAVGKYGAKVVDHRLSQDAGRFALDFIRAGEELNAWSAISSPPGEVFEEDVQSLLDNAFGWAKKDSEYKGFLEELKNDKTFTLDGQLDILYGLAGQMLFSTAVSGYGGYKAGKEANKDRPKVEAMLERIGVSERDRRALTTDKLKLLQAQVDRWQDNPEELKKWAEDADFFMKRAVNDLIGREYANFRQTLEQRGVEPERFRIQTEKDAAGNDVPSFKDTIRVDRVVGDTKAKMMSDVEHGVTIIDNQDGSFTVQNDKRGQSWDINSFEDARNIADYEVERNQVNDLDNEQKILYIQNEVEKNYNSRNVEAVYTIKQLHNFMKAAMENGEKWHGIEDVNDVFGAVGADGKLKVMKAGGFRAKDGTIILILDNIRNPYQANRLLAHESSHGGTAGGGRYDAGDVEFLQQLESAPEYGEFRKGIWDNLYQRALASGADEATARAIADNRLNSEEGWKESFANLMQSRTHKPTKAQIAEYRENEARRRNGENVPFTDADFEVIAAEMERGANRGEGGFNPLSGGNYVEFIDAEEAENPARNAEPVSTIAANPAKTDTNPQSTAEPSSSNAGNGEGKEDYVYMRDKNGRIAYNPDSRQFIADELAKIGKTRETATIEDLSEINKKREEIKNRHINKAMEELRPGYYTVTGGTTLIRKNDDGSIEVYKDGRRRLEDGSLSDPENTWKKISNSGVIANSIGSGDVASAENYNQNGRTLKDIINEDSQAAENAPVGAPGEETEQPTKAVDGAEPQNGASASTQTGSAEPQPQGKPVAERNIVEKLTDKAPAQEVPMDEIEVSDSRLPQFKENADPTTGEVEPLTGEPYDLVSNPIVVMEFKDGKKVVVTGRHRYGLYKRSGRKTIAARIIREADGWTVDDAMAIDAIGNIIDEKGSVKDYVKYFDKATPTRDEAKEAGFLDRPKGRLAFGIFEGASEDTKSLIDWEGTGEDGRISVEQVGVIAEAAPVNAHPRNKAVQRILAQKALNGVRGKKLGVLARSLAEEVKNRKDTPAASGEMQLDLFTSEEDQNLLAMEEKRADYRVKKANEYSRIAEVLRTAISKGGKLDLNGEYAGELGITDPKDRKQLTAARDKAVERANYWENSVSLDAADREAMDAEINAKSDAAAKKLADIKAKREAAKSGKPIPKSTPKKSLVVAKSSTTTKRTVVMKNAEEEAKAKAALDAIDFDTSDLRPKQTELSGGTSRNQNPSGNEYGKKWGFFKRGTRNVDIGAGRFDKATEFLADLGVTNLPFDPVNRDPATNERVANEVRENPADTATVHNVLNVIDNDDVVNGIINQAARAIKPSGRAIFTIYEGDRSGKPRKTRDGFQRNAKASSYLPSINKYFGRSEVHGNVIVASSPKDVGKAFWAYDSTFSNGIDWDTQDFDYEKFGRLVTGVGKLVDVLTASGHKDFKSLATYIYESDAEKFNRAKPVLQDIWNAVARQKGLARITDGQAEEVFASLGTTSGASASMPKNDDNLVPFNELDQKKDADEIARRISAAADAVKALIDKGEKFDRRALEDAVGQHLGGSVAEGSFTPKDAFNILELAVNRKILDRKSLVSPSANVSPDAAVRAITRIREEILAVIPTQTVRSDEQIQMQQFSTPPTEAFCVNWVANLNENDVVLEPSAGIGGIAVFAKNAGVSSIIANELAGSRRSVLEQLGIADNVYGVDAAKIWAHIYPDVNSGKAERPTVVVMNPPFSSSIVSGRHDTISVGGGHIEAALDALAPGGRLVAVVGSGMSYDSDSKSAAAWWKKIGAKYRVMANVRVNGKEYAKYGTDFDNNIIVIDKVAPIDTTQPIYGTIQSLDELPSLLEGVRNARPEINRKPEQSQNKQEGRGGTEGNQTGLESGKSANNGRSGGRGSSSRPVGGRRVSYGSARSDGKGVAGGAASGNDGRGNNAASGFDGRDGSGSGENALASGRDGFNDEGSSGDRGGEAGEREGGGSGLLAVSDLKSENPQSGSEEVHTVGDGTFAEYKPSKLNIPGMKPHPGEIVESAAMASVKTPDITYSPRIPKELVEKGQPSAAQLEVITLAGQAHEQILPNGERRGFFTQDGTGMGKGTEIGGVICDNWNHGRKKSIWISKNLDLFPDAKRDLSTYSLQNEVFKFGDKKKSSKGKNIAFLSYDTLETNASVSDNGDVVSDKGEECNFQKLVKWFGKDYDGVIVFDESHMMANVEGKTSKRGKSNGAKRAIIAVKLQEALPNARVIYASATGATEVSHLACLPRLGLWGEWTSFKTKGEFIDKISKGGLSMMEMVARDMKASGLTLSRALTMEGIVNRPLVHNLSPDQTRRYDECAAAWQEIYDNIFDTVASTGEIHNGKRIGQIIGQMKTSQQRFFNSLLTSMMLPSVIPDMKRNLADGKSIVIQLTETNEAALKRAISEGQKGDDFDPESIDTSPREIIRGYVERYFPTFVYTEVEGDGGKKSWVIAHGADGKPLQDPAAVERKNAILDKIDMMRMDGSPLDAILSEFGYDNVAEVTGRSKRIERIEADGEIRTDIVSRSKKKGEKEANEFNDGDRRILIFSEAGGTGKSYHASRTYKNQQQRVHYLLQAGWSAPPAIQGLGRTNRTNQASKPEYVLCTTDVKGHLRFISSVARRLQQMGSLTSGDRSTAGNGIFNDDQNIEDVYSKRAITQIFTDLFYNEPSEFDRVCRMFGYVRPKVDTRTGERTDKNLLIDEETNDLDTEEIPSVTDFLNIMLHLRIADMNRFFDTFMQTRMNLIETAKENGKYDPGLEKLIAEKIVEKSRTQIYEDPSTGSKTEMVELGVSHKSKKRSYGTVERQIESAKKRGRKAFFAVNKSSNMLYAFVEKDYTSTDGSGRILHQFYRLSPDGTANSVFEDEVRLGEKGNYTEVKDAESAWTEAYDKVPDLIEGNNYYVTGAILPVFGRLGINEPRVKRIEPTGKKTSYLGLEVPNSIVDQVMANFGIGASGGAMSPAAIYRKIVNDGKSVELQHDGWKLKRSKVNYDYTIELVGLEGPEDARRLEHIGYGRFDRSTGKPRFFIPRTEAAVKKFLADYPAKVEKVDFDTDFGDTHDIVKDGKTVFTGRFRTNAQADGYARHFYGDGAKAVRRDTVDFDTNLSATLEPEAWGDLDRKVKVVGNGVAQWKYVKGTKVSEHKATLEKMAYANIEAQPNHVIDERTGNHSLVIDGTRIRISKSGLFHSADRRLQNIGNAIANIGDILNNSVSVPNTGGKYSYRIAEANFGRPEFVLVTLKNVDGNSEVVDLKRVYSVNVKARNAAQSVTSTSVPRPTEDSISNLRAAWQSLFYPGIVKHNNGANNRPRNDIRWDTSDLNPAEAEYAEREDKTPDEKTMREVYGMTNDEIATAMRAAKMEPPKHEKKTDERTWEQAEALLSNPGYMDKLSRALYKFPRPITDYENVALNHLFRQRAEDVNRYQEIYDDIVATSDEEVMNDPEFAAMKKEAKKDLDNAKALMREAGIAAHRAASAQGQALRSNRFALNKHDLSFAGLLQTVQNDMQGVEVPQEIQDAIKKLANDFKSIDEEGRKLATARLKAFSEKVIDDIKRGGKMRRVSEKIAGDEGKRVSRNYMDALAQIEVHAAEAGGTLIGLSDQMYPSWGRWLKYLGEYHCYMNPEITEDEVINEIVNDISPFMDGVDANQVRDALTGFGHNYRQSRYDSQRLMNDLRSQARMKRQLDYMNENNQLPPQTGMIRDEPSDEARRLAREVQERKKETPEGGANRLKSVLESAKTRVRNQIADLERAIENGEAIPRRERTVREDVELTNLKKRRDELRERYDEMFGTKSGMTDEQRINAVEKALSKELERTMKDLARAQSGDFSKRPKRPGVTSDIADALRDEIAKRRQEILDLKKAAYEFGLTPEEIAERNAKKMRAREAAILRMAERIERGDIRPMKKPQPPMPPDMKKVYDEMGEQLRKARQKLAEMRLEAQHSTIPSFRRKLGAYAEFAMSANRALKATMDFSATLRQAARMTLGHPGLAVKSFGKAWDSMSSDLDLARVNDEIMSDEAVREAVDKYGLRIRDIDAENGRDVEMFHGMERNKVKMFGKEFAITDLPIFGKFMLKSERHYITYLNAISAEVYTAAVNDAMIFPGGATPWQKKMICDMINMWNGSAALSKERRQGMLKSGLSNVFWAPTLALSRIQTAAWHDAWRPLVAEGIKNTDGDWEKPSKKERVASARYGIGEHIKSSLAMLALGALIKFMMSDDDDWYQFEKADWFEKLMMLASPKVGNTTIDLTGGEMSVYRLVHDVATRSKRTLTGKMQEFNSGFNAPSTMRLLQRFAEGKLNPYISDLVALWDGKDYTGNDFGWKEAVGGMMPLSVRDIKDQAVQNGIGKTLLTAPLTLLGAGGSTYDRKPYENAVNDFEASNKHYKDIEDDDEMDSDEREAELSKMREENPLMRDDVRADIESDISYIRKMENRAKRNEKKYGEPDNDMLNEINAAKSALLDKIRSARKR